MTDDEINYQNMATQVLRVLTQARPKWEPLYGKLLPAYTALQTSLGELDTKTQQRSGTSSRGYAAARDKGEVATLDAAMPVVQGLKAIYSDGGHPELGKVADYTRTELDAMRGTSQLAVFDDMYQKAQALKTELAQELVTAEQIGALHEKLELYRPLVGAARGQTNVGSTLREAAVQHLGEARQAIGQLDIRVPNLRSALPDLVAAYEKARIIVDAGHGPKGDSAAAK